MLTPFVTITAYSPSTVPSSSVVTPDPTITVYASDTPNCTPNSLCPNLLETAYGFNILFSSGTEGFGQTIVIVDACGDPTISSDLTTFDSTFGLPNPPMFKVTDIGGAPCSDSSWSTETSLDVEYAHVAAPQADIQLLVAAVPNPQDMYRAWTYALTKHLGNQISNSFGGAGCYNGTCNSTIGQGIGSCESTSGTEGVNVAKILQQAQKHKVTVLASSGDSGAEGLGTSQEEAIPGDCQGVLTVGGTVLTVSASGVYEGETAWSGSAGGYMTNTEPKYQIFANITDPYNTLGKPDVAADASPSSGVEIYNDGSWEVIGGTSVACPLWAGFMADVNQMRAVNGLQPAGFVNQFLYETVYGVNGSSSLYLQDFHEVTSGNNNPWPAGPGWNAVTGLGSFIVPALAKTLGSSPSA